MFNEKTKISDSFKMSGIKKAEEGLKICGKVRLIGHNKMAVLPSTMKCLTLSQMLDLMLFALR